MILGDNQTVLKDIKPLYAQKVDLIYIDPPYNRGDNFKFYKDAKKHDEWIEGMKSTLYLLKDFLQADGSIWVSIDDFEMAYLKICCDSVFGRKNFVSTIVWQKRKKEK